MEIVANGTITSVGVLSCGLVSSWISINCQNTLNGISFVFSYSKNINPIHRTKNIPQKSLPFPICISSVAIPSLLLAKSWHPLVIALYVFCHLFTVFHIYLATSLKIFPWAGFSRKDVNIHTPTFLPCFKITLHYIE